MSKYKATDQAVEAILDDLYDRRGIGDEMQMFIKDEITKTWENIIDNAITVEMEKKTDEVDFAKE